MMQAFAVAIPPLPFPELTLLRTVPETEQVIPLPVLPRAAQLIMTAPQLVRIPVCWRFPVPLSNHRSG